MPRKSSKKAHKACKFGKRKIGPRKGSCLKAKRRK
jgi:hypothetical protein